MSTDRKPPKISIVTPSYNQGRYLEETIRSVLDQNYPNLEYIVIDGGSTDGSVEIIRKYADRLTYWVSERDKGHMDAVNKGFAHATGEIMAWLNSDDKYCPWSFDIVGRAFSALPQVRWLTSQTHLLWNKTGQLQTANHAHRFARTWFYRGWTVPIQPEFKDFIMQEATFWRRDLWEQAGGRVDASMPVAGDFELWARFFEHADLVSTDIPLAGFRYHGEQISADRQRYQNVAKGVLARYRHKTVHNRTAQAFLRWLLQTTGRGGGRFGSKQVWIQCEMEADVWVYRFRYII
jgi:glycosyltransferase involved in cell wall biosynthesis